jgi:hypothetical protein
MKYFNRVSLECIIIPKTIDLSLHFSPTKTLAEEFEDSLGEMRKQNIFRK